MEEGERPSEREPAEDDYQKPAVEDLQTDGPTVTAGSGPATSPG